KCMKFIKIFRPSIHRGGSVRILRIMKLTILIMTTFLLQVNANSLAQNVTLKQKNITLKQVFNQIRKQTGFGVVWQSGKINSDKQIDANFEKESLRVVLDKILKPQNLIYSIADKTIVVRPGENSAVTISNLQQPVSGTVRTITGATLPGATVSIKNTNIRTQTDNNGRFSFPRITDNGVLVIS